jgi:hypothetical protein
MPSKATMALGLLAFLEAAGLNETKGCEKSLVAWKGCWEWLKSPSTLFWAHHKKMVCSQITVHKRLPV